MSCLPPASPSLVLFITFFTRFCLAHLLLSCSPTFAPPLVLATTPLFCSPTVVSSPLFQRALVLFTTSFTTVCLAYPHFDLFPHLFSCSLKASPACLQHHFLITTCLACRLFSCTSLSHQLLFSLSTSCHFANHVIFFRTQDLPHHLLSETQPLISLAL